MTPSCCGAATRAPQLRRTRGRPGRGTAPGSRPGLKVTFVSRRAACWSRPRPWRSGTPAVRRCRAGPGGSWRTLRPCRERPLRQQLPLLVGELEPRDPLRLPDHLLRDRVLVGGEGGERPPEDRRGDPHRRGPVQDLPSGPGARVGNVFGRCRVRRVAPTRDVPWLPPFRRRAVEPTRSVSPAMAGRKPAPRGIPGRLRPLPRVRLACSMATAPGSTAYNSRHGEKPVKRFPNVRLAAVATVLGTVWAATLVSQTTSAQDAAERRIALEKLTVVGSALYVGAHPDDENTALLAWLANGRKVRAGYLSLTRGDGGQNLIGTEQGDLLGVIRTEELLAARRIDGAEQFFTRAVDFGYSKTPEETLRIWGTRQCLRNVVWVIRTFRPDVIVTRFPANGDGGHGHHTASAILAAEAFAAAADATRFPEQLAYVKPWQAKRMLWNAWRRAGERPATAPSQLSLTSVRRTRCSVSRTPSSRRRAGACTRARDSGPRRGGGACRTTSSWWLESRSPRTSSKVST